MNDRRGISLFEIITVGLGVIACVAVVLLLAYEFVEVTLPLMGY